MGLGKTWLSLTLGVCRSQDVPVISSLGVFMSSTWYVGAREVAAAPKTVGVGETVNGEGFLGKAVPFLRLRLLHSLSGCLRREIWRT